MSLGSRFCRFLKVSSVEFSPNSWVYDLQTKDYKSDSTGPVRSKTKKAYHLRMTFYDQENKDYFDKLFWQIQQDYGQKYYSLIKSRKALTDETSSLIYQVELVLLSGTKLAETICDHFYKIELKAALKAEEIIPGNNWPPEKLITYFR